MKFRYKSLESFDIIKNGTIRCLFKTLSSIYDRGILQKQLTDKSRELSRTNTERKQDTNGEKGVQIGILEEKIETQR